MKPLTRFGRLVVTERAASSRQGKAKWKCRCDCGKDKIILADSLKSGRTQSCGCLHREIVTQRAYKDFKWEKAGDCIICTSHKATNGAGYPVLNYYGNRAITISRVILLHRLKVKSSPLFALHLCDNPKCINPAHIVGGTHQENMDQMVSRGRTLGIRVGERNGHAKLKAFQVQAIRAAEGILPVKEIAAKYGIHPVYVWAIWRGETWKHVKPI
jgi:hypothetical protein